jgi:hypothetical protein
MHLYRLSSCPCCASGSGADDSFVHIRRRVRRGILREPVFYEGRCGECRGTLISAPKRSCACGTVSRRSGSAPFIERCVAPNLQLGQLLADARLLLLCGLGGLLFVPAIDPTQSAHSAQARLALPGAAVALRRVPSSKRAAYELVSRTPIVRGLSVSEASQCFFNNERTFADQHFGAL